MYHETAAWVIGIVLVVMAVGIRTAAVWVTDLSVAAVIEFAVMALGTQTIAAPDFAAVVSVQCAVAS